MLNLTCLRDGSQENLYRKFIMLEKNILENLVMMGKSMSTLVVSIK